MFLQALFINNINFLIIAEYILLRDSYESLAKSPGEVHYTSDIRFSDTSLSMPHVNSKKDT
jgi:hypothetical protein